MADNEGQAFIARSLLLDNDGVLVESSKSIRRSFGRWGKAYGFDGDHVFEEFGGRRSVDIAAIVLGPDFAAEAAARLDELELEDAESVRACPGAAELLASLAGEWTLVTSGGRRLATARLQAAGLPVPKILVSAELISNGKPDPECYLLAAKLNGAPPKECVAFEDSSHGVAAAVSAGCSTVHVGYSGKAAGVVAEVVSLREVRATRGTGYVAVRLLGRTGSDRKG
jgi:sugar-phosphatase